MKKFLIITILFLTSVSFTLNSSMQDYIKTLKEEAKKSNPDFKGFDVQRGKKIFTGKHIGKRGEEISCTSCHGTDLSKSGQNERTGKVIDPLSPKTNPERLTDVKHVKKWLRRNFKDVYNREGTAQEKGDVLTFILSK